MNLLNLILIISTKYIIITDGHTWIDELSCSCPESIGYPRSYLGRESIPDTFDIYNTYNIGKDENSNLCSPHQTRDFNYEKYPKLKCAPGSIVKFKYNPNGHISLDQFIPGDPRGSRPSNSLLPKISYWYIASNKDIYPNELIIRSDINENNGLNINSSYDNNLKNMISVRNPYDINGECSDGQVCEGSFILPMDLKNHTNYQFIFYHILDRNPFSSTHEEFSSCMTIHIHYNKDCMKTTTQPPKKYCD
jgi:hypothetical protein